VPWVSPFRWETKRIAATRRKTRVTQRVCFRYELLAAFLDSPCGDGLLLRRIGRQAPVKRCLARFAKLSLRIFFAGRLMPRPTIKEILYPYGSICLMLATSALFTSVSFLSLRMRPGLFVPIKWRLPEWPRLILPLAVNLKRFLAPRCVFSFNFGFDAFLGIAGNPLDNFTVPLAAAGGASPSPTKLFPLVLQPPQRG
jgi:hypothetical protein